MSWGEGKARERARVAVVRQREKCTVIAGPGKDTKDDAATSGILTTMDGPSNSGNKGVNCTYIPSTCHNNEYHYCLTGKPNICHNTTTTNMHTPNVLCNKMLTTSVSTHSASHIPMPTTTASGTGNPATVNGHTQADKNHPPQTPVKCPRPPDNEDDVIELAGREWVEARESGEVRVEVEVVMDASSDSMCPLDLPVAHPGSTEDSSQLQDAVHDTMCPPNWIQVNPGIHIETSQSRHITHGRQVQAAPVRLGSVKRTTRAPGLRGSKSDHVKTRRLR